MIEWEYSHGYSEYPLPASASFTPAKPSKWKGTYEEPILKKVLPSRRQQLVCEVDKFDFSCMDYNFACMDYMLPRYFN